MLPQVETLKIIDIPEHLFIFSLPASPAIIEYSHPLAWHATFARRISWMTMWRFAFITYLTEAAHYSQPNWLRRLSHLCLGIPGTEFHAPGQPPSKREWKDRIGLRNRPDRPSLDLDLTASRLIVSCMWRIASLGAPWLRILRWHSKSITIECQAARRTIHIGHSPARDPDSVLCRGGIIGEKEHREEHIEGIFHSYYIRLGTK
jgi:hypothetical protein